MTAFVWICIGVIIALLVFEAWMVMPDKLMFWKRKKK